MGNLPEMVTIREAAALKAVSPKTIRRAIAAGKIDGWRVGSAIRIKRADLDRLFTRIPAAGDRW